MRRGQKALIIVFASLAGLLGAGYLALYLVINDRVLGNLVEGELNPVIRGKVVLGRARWRLSAISDLFRGRPHTVVIEDVVITDPRREEVIRAERLEATLRLRPLVSHQDVRIAEVRLRGARARIVARRGQSGTLDVNLIEAFTPRHRRPPSGGGVILHIEKVRVDDVDLVLDYPDWQLAMHRIWGEGELYLSTKGKGDPAFDFQIVPHASSGELTIAGRKHALSAMKFDWFGIPRPARDALYLSACLRIEESPTCVKGGLVDLWSKTPAGMGVNLDLTATRAGSLLSRWLGPGFAEESLARASLVGPLSAPEARLYLQKSGFRRDLGGVPLELTEASAWLSLRIGGLGHGLVLGRWAGGALTAVADLDTATFRYDIRAALEGAALDRAPPAIGGWAGPNATASGRAALRGSLLGGANGPFELEARLKVRRPRARRGPRELSADAAGTLEKGRLVLTRALVEADGNRVRVKGAAWPELRRTRLTVNAPALAALLRRLDLPQVARRLDADLELSGPPLWPQASGHATLRGVGLGEAGQLSEAKARLRLRSGRLELDPLEGSVLGGQLQLRGGVHLFPGSPGRLDRPDRDPRLDLKLLAKKLDLAQLSGAGDVPLAGRLSLEGSVTGPLSSPSGQARLQLERLAVAGHSLGSGALELRAARRLAVERFVLTRPDGLELSGKADLALALGGRHRAELTLKRVPLVALPGLSALPGSGGHVSAQLSAEVERLGGRTAPRVKVSGRLDLAAAMLRGVPLGNATLTVDTIRTSAGAASGGAATGDEVRVRGRLFDRFDVDARLALRARGRSRLRISLSFRDARVERFLPDLRRLGNLQARASGRVLVEIEDWRLVRLEAQLSRLAVALVSDAGRALSELRNRGDIVVRYRGPAPGRGPGHWELSPASLVGSAGYLGLSGRLIPGDGQRPLSLDLALQGKLELRTLEALAGRRLGQVRGTVELGLRVSGPLTGPRLQGTVRLENASALPVGWERPLVVRDGRARVDVGGPSGEVVLETIALTAEQSLLAASGRVGLDGFKPKAVRLEVRGTLNGRLLPLVLPAYVTHGWGQLPIEVEVNGPAGDPDLHGAIRFENVGLQLRGIGRPLVVHSGRVILSRHAIRIDDAHPLRASLDDGSVTLGGELQLKGWRLATVDLRMRGQNLFFRVPNIMQLEVNPSLRLTGSAQGGLRLSGDVEVADGRYVQKFDLKDLVFRPRIEESEPPPWAGVPTLEQLALDLRVRSQSLSVRNNLGEIGLTAETVVTGTLSAPVLEGQFRVVGGTFRIPGLRGEYRLQGESVTFSRRDVDFDAGHRINPQVLIRAQATVEDYIQNKYEVGLLLKGHLSQLEIRLTSNPPLEQGQILLLLTTGRTTDELRTASTAVNTQGRSTGVAGASDQAARELTAAWLREWVGDKLSDVTKLELRLELGTEAFKVQAGRRFGLWGRVWGDFERSYAGTWRRGLRLEARLSDNFALETGAEQRLLLESALIDQQVLTNARLQLKFRTRVGR